MEFNIGKYYLRTRHDNDDVEFQILGKCEEVGPDRRVCLNPEFSKELEKKLEALIDNEWKGLRT